MKIAILPGDGIGPEITAEAVKVLQALDLQFEMETAPVGGAAYAASGHPLPEATLTLAQAADAILFGAVGDWQYDTLERALRPEQAILGLRKHLGLFANFRPAICYEQLTHASSLKSELVAGLDILIIRELTGDIYFGQPRGRRTASDGHFPGADEAFDTMRYTRPEIERIARVAFEAARQRSRKVTSVDKANVLETSQFWRDVVIEVHQGYPDVELSHMYVDNAAMQLVRAPKAFDVIFTGNLFGDILSDEAAMLTGSFFPPEVVDWFRSLPYWYEDEHAIYVHAGLPHGPDGFLHPKDVKAPIALLWCRDEAFFRDYRGKRVVFGHTRTEYLPPELSGYTPDDPTDLWAGPAVIGIDTGWPTIVLTSERLSMSTATRWRSLIGAKSLSLAR